MSDISRIEFDGVTVSLIGNDGTVITTSTAVSGQPGFQNPAFQDQKMLGRLQKGNTSLNLLTLTFVIGIIQANGYNNAGGYYAIRV